MNIFPTLFSQPGTVMAAVMAVLAINIMLLALFAYAIVSFLKKIAWTQQESEKTKQQAMQEASAVRDQARREAEHIISEAHGKATEAIKKIDILGGEMQQDLEKALEAVYKREVERLARTADQLVTEYRSLLDEVRKKHTEASEAAVHQMMDGSGAAVQMFQKFLEDQMSVYRQDMEHRIEESQKAAQKEIEAYKAQAFKKVEDSIYRIIQFVSQRVLGEAISIEQHRKLIVTALEEAKREGLFET